MGRYRADVAGMRAAHAEDAVHSLLLVGGASMTATMSQGRELVAVRKGSCPCPTSSADGALQTERAVTAGKQDDGSDRLAGLMRMKAA